MQKLIVVKDQDGQHCYSIVHKADGYFTCEDNERCILGYIDKNSLKVFDTASRFDCSNK